MNFLLLKCLALVIISIGFIVVFLAKKIVIKYNLDKYYQCEFDDELTETELLEFKLTKAIVNVKMIGILISLPGLIILMIAFK